MRLNGTDEQACTCPLPYDELVQLQRCAQKARVASDPLTGRVLRSNVPRGWLDKEMTWLASHDGSPGRPAVFSDAAIEFCLSIKVLFKLPLRQTVGRLCCTNRLKGFTV